MRILIEKVCGFWSHYQPPRFWLCLFTPTWILFFFVFIFFSPELSFKLLSVQFQPFFFNKRNRVEHCLQRRLLQCSIKSCQGFVLKKKWSKAFSRWLPQKGHQPFFDNKKALNGLYFEVTFQMITQRHYNRFESWAQLFGSNSGLKLNKYRA